MLAEVTNNKCVMYQIGSTKFFLNRSVLVRDSSVIRRAQITSGFSVHVIKRDSPKKRVKVLRDTSGKTKRAKTATKKASRKPQ